MKFYTFGKKENPVIVLFPGTCCHWKMNFGHVIPYLEQDFYVVCVSYDGFDEREQSIFPDMITETVKVEEYIKDNFGGRICVAYGCSLGGSFIGLLLQREEIHMEHGIIGSSDMDQAGKFSAKLQAWLITKVLYCILQKGKLPGWMQKRMNQKPQDDKAYYEAFLNLFLGTEMSFVKKESIRNQFYWDLVTPIQENIEVHGTVVHCFYSMKRGEKYLERYLKHFKNPRICPQYMNHEELLLCYPEEWAKQVKGCR